MAASNAYQSIVLRETNVLGAKLLYESKKIIVLKRVLFVYMYHDDSLTSYHVNQTTNYHTIICTTSETEDEVVHVKLV